VLPPVWEEGGSLVRSPRESRDPLLHVVDVHGPRKPNLFSYDVTQLRRVIRAVRPEVVDLHEEPYSAAAAGVLIALQLEGLRVPFCVYSAQNLVDRRYPPPFSWIEQAVLSRAGAAFPCSRQAGERLRRRGFARRVHVIPLGVEVMSHSALEARLNQELTAQQRPLRVGFIGRLEPNKGGLIAVRAFSTVAQHNPALKLEVIGAGSEAAALHAEARRTGVGARVSFRGALTQDETLRRLGDMQIVLVPSLTTPTWKEQYGRVAAQAMSEGVGVIASDSGSLPEVLGDAGLLVTEGDSDVMAATLKQLVEDPARLAELRRRGRDRAAGYLSWDAVAAQVDAMYRELLDHA
jgi:glycosyltransferase involved in cell wall biosynthesis